MSAENKHSIYVDHRIWEQVVTKCGNNLKISQVIRTLLIKWLSGEIKITMEDLTK